MSEAAPTKQPFPAAFYVANTVELLERLAFYGTYVVLSVYLSDVVKLDDVVAGDVLALYAFFRLGPILGGVLADRIGFRVSLVISLVVYALGYGALLAARDATMARVAIVLIGVAGALFKPIITAMVVRTSPPGRQTEGFAIFYRMVNSGSVVGKTITYGIRVWLKALALVPVTPVIASAAAALLSLFALKEPARVDGTTRPGLMDVLRGVGRALAQWRFTAAILILSGFYFMSEQAYQTFPKYVTRAIDPNAPLEWVTLVNPACIAIFQGLVTARTKRLSAVGAMVLASFVGAVSMTLMGFLPGLIGAGVAFAVFAFAEMTFAPRFYDYVAGFAPKGQEATFMGLTVVPVAIGGMIGGVVSGRLIKIWLPEHGPRATTLLWTTYAACGLACAVLMYLYHRLASRPAHPA